MENKIEYKEFSKNQAGDLTSLIKELSKQSEYYPFTAVDYNVSLNAQVNFINYMNNMNNCVLYGAFVDEKPVGVVYLQGGSKAKTAHSCQLGIGVLKQYSKSGIGTNLMKMAIKYAYDCNVIGKINLQVVKENKPAISLYKKMGFVIEGIETRALFQNNRFFDYVNMGLIIE